MYICNQSFLSEMCQQFFEGTEYPAILFDALTPHEQSKFSFLTEKEIEISWLNKLLGGCRGVTGAALCMTDNEVAPTMLTMGDFDSPDNRPNDEIKQAWELSRRTFRTPFNNNSENTVPRY